jgi:hypothetical protein
MYGLNGMQQHGKALKANDLKTVKTQKLLHSFTGKGNA